MFVKNLASYAKCFKKSDRKIFHIFHIKQYFSNDLSTFIEIYQRINSKAPNLLHFSCLKKQAFFNQFRIFTNILVTSWNN